MTPPHGWAVPLLSGLALPFAMTTQGPWSDTRYRGVCRLGVGLEYARAVCPRRTTCGICKRLSAAAPLPVHASKAAVSAVSQPDMTPHDRRKSLRPRHFQVLGSSETAIYRFLGPCKRLSPHPHAAP
jgi:hypothetical protein